MKIALMVVGLYLIGGYLTALVMGAGDLNSKSRWTDKEVFWLSVLWPLTAIIAAISAAVLLVNKVGKFRLYKASAKKIGGFARAVTLPFRPYEMGLELAKLICRGNKESDKRECSGGDGGTTTEPAWTTTTIQLAMAENTIELAGQCIEELQNHFRGTPVTRQSIIRDYIIPWAKEAEEEWQRVCLAGNDEMYQYYDFIDDFARRKKKELGIEENGSRGA